MTESLRHALLHSLEHGFFDTLKLLPFLFLTYALLEYLEHVASSKMTAKVAAAGKLGPLFGGVLGAIPQCGFASAAASFYAGRVISLGTLYAVFLATSDEMLPILLSSAIPAGKIAAILGIKVLVGLFVGFLVDAVVRPRPAAAENDIHVHCEEAHVHGWGGVLIAALRHTLDIALFLFLLSFAIGFFMELGGETLISGLPERPLLGVLLAALVGLIPNCSASVVLTSLYVQGLAGGAQLIAGLLVNAGAGLLVLCRANRSWKENLRIIAALWGISVAVGILLQLGGFAL